eukprot:TRINITY_DN30910_c0_g1_i1.p1 TRINITY_DN30910_c0_g1~~TRINITY_DN30910_c0_g1_i1.p1  ORF type:complete len:168 (+),score=31.17 TRINITY_DN30910_c0_g1_i1:33-536(+)
MSGLLYARIRGSLLPTLKKQITCVRMMSGDPYGSGAPAHSTGGMFRYPIDHPPPSHEEISEWVKKQKADNWKSLGYDQFDPKADAEMHKLSMFCLVTLSFVVGCFIFAYSPETHKQDWYQREAFLLLREREAAGVEPISKDLVDPEKILAGLPSDEELKEAGVVIMI